jgi:virginiamycin A acetyltransferase
MDLRIAGVSPPGRDNSIPDYVEIGAHTYYDGDNIRFVGHIPGEKIVIGKYCSIAYGVHIFVGGNHRIEAVSTYPFDNLMLGKDNPTRSYKSTRNTEIGSDVWLGYRSHVVGGVHIGHGAVVGSRSVVFSDVPPYCIVAGNPARPVRYRFSRTIVTRLLRIAWWDWPDEVVRSNLDWFYRPVTEFVEHFDLIEGMSDGTVA